MIRKFDAKTDYEDLKFWWDFYKFPRIPLSCLPNGFVSCDSSGASEAMVFVYETNTELAWMEWLTVNPFIMIDDRRLAVEECLNEAKRFAKEQGLTLFTVTDNKKLIEKYKRHGFVESCNNSTQMIWRS